jgi:hypothetical protein
MSKKSTTAEFSWEDLRRECKRGQVTWALWREFSGHTDIQADEAVPELFDSRIRTLFKLGIPIPNERKPGQPGVDIVYSTYHAVELATALRLQETNGLNQAEAAFVVQFLRRGRGDRSHEQQGLPFYFRRALNDPAPIFLVFAFKRTQKFKPPKWAVWEGRGDPPSVDAFYCEGFQSLESWLAMQINAGASSWTVLEIGGMARRITKNLREAPRVGRGRAV